MKVKVKGIPLAGLDLVKSLEPSEIGLSEDDINCIEPLDITARIERIQNTIIASVEVTTKVSFSCSRCLEDVERDVANSFKFDYVVEDNTEFIDIGEDIRQEMILDAPARVLCSDDCRGICLHCGANLNEEECQCGK